MVVVVGAVTKNWGVFGGAFGLFGAIFGIAHSVRMNYKPTNWNAPSYKYTCYNA